MIQTEPKPADKSTVSTQLFLIDGDELLNLPTEYVARRKDWEFSFWQKTGHAPLVSRYFR